MLLLLCMLWVAPPTVSSTSWLWHMSEPCMLILTDTTDTTDTVDTVDTTDTVDTVDTADTTDN